MSKSAIHTTQKHAIRLSKVGNLISTAKREGTTLRLSSILSAVQVSIRASKTCGGTAHPFHAVGRCGLTEHGIVVQNCGVSSVGELGVVRSTTEVELSSGLGKSVELGCGGRLPCSEWQEDCKSGEGSAELVHGCENCKRNMCPLLPSKVQPLHSLNTIRSNGIAA